VLLVVSICSSCRAHLLMYCTSTEDQQFSTLAFRITPVSCYWTLLLAQVSDLCAGKPWTTVTHKRRR
jgi:hypothetical protein